MSSNSPDARLYPGGTLEERVTFRAPSEVLEPYRDAVDRGEYPNLSEALRAGLREGAPSGDDDEPASVQPTNPGGVVRDE